MNMKLLCLIACAAAVTNAELYNVEFEVQLSKGKSGTFVMEVSKKYDRYIQSLCMLRVMSQRDITLQFVLCSGSPFTPPLVPHRPTSSHLFLSNLGASRVGAQRR